jgi:phosphohistidine swiveling domain-containing protein
MNALPGKPAAPPSVAYALTVPQSVLFADLSLRGNKRGAFASVFDLDYEPSYIEIDNGAMAWDYSLDEPFVSLISDGLDIAAALERFIEAIGRTARDVEKTSYVLSSVLPLPTNIHDLRDVLREYWDTYELQMPTLFMYWNVGAALSQLLNDELTELGFESEVENGFPRFMVPSEPNYFVRERANRERIKRFALGGKKVPPTLSDATKELVAAAKAHAAHYGFLLAPFNLGSPPDAADVLRSLDLADPADAAQKPPAIDDLPPFLRRLARLSRQFTFWKSERLDIMALGDARMLPHYRAAATLLDCPIEAIFSLTRDELDHALTSGAFPGDVDAMLARSHDYCLVLANGSIGFCLPSPREEAATQEAAVGTVLRGSPASAGIASGVVRVVRALPDLEGVKAGDILITPMTRPEYGVALDHAAAFVTDEGSRHCHAAIIAREMHKPCVISTGSATNLLRNGMRVTVDGGKGTVEVTAAANES